MCPAGSYCTTPAENAECPAEYYCIQGSTEPTECPAGANCPKGSTANPFEADPFEAAVTLAMPVGDFIDGGFVEMFMKSISLFLPDSAVTEDEVTVECICAAPCSQYGGETPKGNSCDGASSTARMLQEGNVTTPSAAPVDVWGSDGSLSDASLPQDNDGDVTPRGASESTEVVFSVRVDDNAQRLAFQAFVKDSANKEALAASLVEAGFSEDVAASADIAVIYSASDLAGPPPDDFTQVLITVMFAVPVAMLVVALAMYQNSKKAKPVKLPGLITAVVFAFYDFFSDVWFAMTPVPREYAGFTIAAAVAVGVATLVGAGIVGYALYHHTVPEWGVVDVLTAVLAVTNPDLLSLLPWEGASDLYEGMPDAMTARLPVLGVMVEDLPQLFIQGFYLITSGDTGNLVVLVSVSMSGCSLLLRFVRGAFAFMQGTGESNLVGTSPMREWTSEKVKAWVTEVARASDPSLSLLDCLNLPVLSLSAPQWLALVDAFINAQRDLDGDESEDKDGNARFAQSQPNPAPMPKEAKPAPTPANVAIGV